ncbi:MAG: hypothetical protein HUU47_09685 [Bacteroidetes bacterium]|nr:hypothetical protein [Bacteroidota bacterium]
MKKKEIVLKLNQLITEVETAEDELCRPFEDVVSLSVCHRVRNSISEILKLFLDFKSIKYNDNENVEQLYNLCAERDKEFKNVDISSVYCKYENHNSQVNQCSVGVGEVENCTKIAKQLMELILNKI